MCTHSGEGRRTRREEMAGSTGTRPTELRRTNRLRRRPMAIVAVTLALAACSDETTDSGPPVQEPEDDAPTPTDAEPPDVGAVSVFVFAENETEARYYEAFSSNFSLATDIDVQLEVRLP